MPSTVALFVKRFDIFYAVTGFFPILTIRGVRIGTHHSGIVFVVLFIVVGLTYIPTIVISFTFRFFYIVPSFISIFSWLQDLASLFVAK